MSSYQCFCCGKKLLGLWSEALKHDYQDPPFLGVCFNSRGNYGSQVLDIGSESIFVEIVVCDNCLIKNKKRANTVRTKTYEVTKGLP